jgi:hypothetical protein
LGFGVATVALLLYIRRLRRALAVALQRTAALPKGTRPPFQPIQVDDERLNLRWYIRQPPHDWLNYQDVRHRLSPSAVQEIIDGPYHAVCLERVQEENASFGGSGHTSPVLLETCPSCGARLFTTPHRHLEPTVAFSWKVRAQAVQELQRMHRGGTRIEGPRLVLEKPLYWGDMEPARLVGARDSG